MGQLSVPHDHIAVDDHGVYVLATPPVDQGIYQGHLGVYVSLDSLYQTV